MTELIQAHLDHRRLWRDFDYCYPVISRRSRGVSLGMNLNPDKVCNFNCVYCEVDRQSPPKRKDLDLDLLERELGLLLDLATSGEFVMVAVGEDQHPEPVKWKPEMVQLALGSPKVGGRANQS